MIYRRSRAIALAVIVCLASSWSAADPPPAGGESEVDLAKLVARYEALVAVEEDKSKTAAERAEAGMQAIAAMTQLVEGVARQWAKLDPILKKIGFEMATTAERTSAEKQLVDFQASTQATLARLKQRIAKIDDLPQHEFNKQLPLIEKVFQAQAQLNYLDVMAALGRAQTAWTKDLAVPADRSTVNASLDRCNRFFGGMVTAEALAEDRAEAQRIVAEAKTPDARKRAEQQAASMAERRSLALLYMAQANLYAGQYPLAGELADRLITDAAIPAINRFAGFTIKAQALRGQKQFGGGAGIGAGNVRRWLQLCTELARHERRPAPSPYRRIWELLTPAEQATIKKIVADARQQPTADEQAAILAALNRMVAQPDFYKAEHFKDVILSPEATRLRNQVAMLAGPVLLRFNVDLLSTALGANLEADRAGAMATLAEQETFLDNQPTLKDDVYRLLAIRVVRANTLMMQAIEEIQPLLDRREAAIKADRKDEAETLLAQARAPYERARSAAESEILTAESKNPKTRDFQAAAVELIRTVSAMETATRLPPGQLPTAEQLAHMSRFQLRRMGDTGMSQGRYDIAEAYYGQMLAKSTSDTEKIEAGKLFGHANYNWALDMRRASQKGYDARLAKADETFRQMLQKADGTDRELFHRYLVSIAMLREGLKANRDLRSKLIETLQQAIRAGVDVNANRGFLADAYNAAQDFRSAADAYAMVELDDDPENYARARTGQCAMLIEHYFKRPPPPTNPQQLILDIGVIDKFAEFAVAEAKRLRALPRPETPPSTQPDDLHPADRILNQAAVFKLEAAWILFDRLGNERQDEAIRMIDEVIAAHPDNPRLINNGRSKKIRILLKNEKIEDAVGDLLELLRDDAESALGYATRALRDMEQRFLDMRASAKRPQDAEKFAVLAEKFARGLHEHGSKDARVTPLVREYFLVCHSRALNWLGRANEAAQQLEPRLYREIDGERQITNNQDLLVELGDAYFALNEFDKAITCFDQVVMAQPLWGQEVWWRAVLGKAESVLEQGEPDARRARTSLTRLRDSFKDDEEKKLPEWLLPRFMRIDARYNSMILDDPIDEPAAPIAATAVQDQGMGTGMKVGLILGGGVFALAAASLLGIVYTRRQMRARAEHAAMMRRRPGQRKPKKQNA